jgi:hypothetical protein
MKHSTQKQSRNDASIENLYDFPGLEKETHVPKRKVIPSKSQREAIRKRYTWHLRDPDFDCSHWWKRKDSTDYSEIAPLAALYEVVRRHPKVPGIPYPPIPVPAAFDPDNRYKIASDLYEMFPPPESFRFLSRFARRSWLKLTRDQRERWKSSIGKMKSFDERSNESLSCNLTCATYLALLRAQEEIERETTASMPPEYSGLGLWGWASFPSQPEWEKAIADEAVKAHRQGRVLIAIESHLAADKAVAAMKKAYLAHSYVDSSPVTRPRSRWKQWLDIIVAFENSVADEPAPAKANSQLFVRYRRVIDGIVFPERFKSAGDALRSASPT